MKKRLLILTIIFVMIMGTFSVSHSFAAVSASLSGGGTYNPGDTVTMTLRFYGGTFGAVEAKVSYDSSVLTYSSCSATYNTGSNTIVMSTASASELSCTLTFKAAAVGSTTVSVTTVEGATAELEAFSASTSAKVTVKEAAPPASSGGSDSSSSSGSSSSSSGNSGSSGTSSKPGTSTSSGTAGNRSEFSEESTGVPEEIPVEEPQQKPEKLEVVIGDKTYVIIEDLKEKDLPAGFQLGTTKYDVWEVPACLDEESGLTLLYLEDKESGEKQFFIYDEATGAFSAQLPVSLKEYLEYREFKAEGESKAPAVMAGFALVAALAAIGLEVARLKGYNPFKKE